MAARLSWDTAASLVRLYRARVEEVLRREACLSRAVLVSRAALVSM